jgi:hypothetical protein
MLWSFSRDGGVPLYRVWASVNPRTGTPTNAVWAMTALAFLLGLPMLWSIAAFQAIGSVSSIGLWLSCARSATCSRLHQPSHAAHIACHASLDAQTAEPEKRARLSVQNEARLSRRALPQG